MGSEGGHGISHSQHRHNADRLDSHSRGITGQHRSSEAVDNRLNQKNPNLHNRLLDNRGNRNPYHGKHKPGIIYTPVFICFIPLQLPQKQPKRNYSRHSLSNQSTHSNPSHPLLKPYDKQHIQENIQQRGKYQQIQRRPGISQRIENGRLHIIHKQKRQPGKIYSQIKRCVRKNLSGRIHPSQNPVIQEKSQRSQANTHHKEVDKRGEYGCLHFAFLSCAETLGDDHRTSNPSADSNGNKYICNRIRGTYSGQRPFPNKISNDHRICDIIKLLKKIP